MALHPGTRLGPYEIVAPLGAGGMGEVYRARDTRLGRDVAVKALPEGFERDPDRVARFAREAKLMASLSHPSIAAIHGLEEVGGAQYLVLEFVEGETLAQRLTRGALPLDEAADVCRQIAAGVEAAHESGVVHRDLKPANVMLTPAGTVKVLDFGLARAGAVDRSGADLSLSDSPTMSHVATLAGVILGTAAYMSPEQARGRMVDRRSDIWSFGCVLYECLAGRRTFEGETVSDLVARILEREPDWSALPATTPARVRELLKRCLTKDPRQRLRDIGEARIVLEREDEPVTSTAAAAPRRRARWLGWAPWVLLAVVGGVAVWRGLAERTVTAAGPGERRVEIAYPVGQNRVFSSTPAVSPDGRWLVVAAADSTGTQRLWLRELANFGWRPLPKTEGASYPFWSPDSRTVAFFSTRLLMRVDVGTGVVDKIADAGSGGRGGSWGPDGTILYAPAPNTAIHRVSAAGGTPVAVTHLDSTLVDGSHRFPVWLPDGEHFLFVVWSNNAAALAEKGGIYAASTRGGDAQRVSSDFGSFQWLPSGHLLLMRHGNLVAVPFDSRSRRVGEGVVPVAERVGFGANAGVLRASANAAGDVVYDLASDQPAGELWWLDRQGQPTTRLGLQGDFVDARLSPDGSRIAVEMDDATGLTHISIVEIARGTISRLTRSQNDSYAPVWSTDGEQIAFNNRDSGTEDLYVQAASGATPRRLVWSALPVDARLTDWSSDARYLLFDGHPRQGGGATQVWIADLVADSVRVLLADDFAQQDARLSPDGRWIAYVSRESGREELYVRSFPDRRRRWLVSTGGAADPHWRRDGRELVFNSAPAGDRSIWSVAVSPSGDGLAFGPPQRLFTMQAEQILATPDADHARFLAQVLPTSAAEAPMRAVLGWRPPVRP